MIALLVYIFVLGAGGAVSHNSKCLKVLTFRLDDVTVVKIHRRMLWHSVPYKTQIVQQRFFLHALCQMLGKTIHDINFSTFLMQGVSNLAEQAASGGQHSVKHIRKEFLFCPGQARRNFL